jgi:Flp pilus assembly protein TadB
VSEVKRYHFITRRDLADLVTAGWKRSLFAGLAFVPFMPVLMSSVLLFLGISKQPTVNIAVLVVVTILSVCSLLMAIKYHRQLKQLKRKLFHSGEGC